MAPRAIFAICIRLADGGKTAKPFRRNAQVAQKLLGNASYKREQPAQVARAASNIWVCDEKSALGELITTTSLHLAELLTFDDAAVTGQEAALLEDAPQLWLKVGERLGDAMSDGTGLT